MLMSKMIRNRKSQINHLFFNRTTLKYLIIQRKHKKTNYSDLKMIATFTALNAPFMKIWVKNAYQLVQLLRETQRQEKWV